MSRGNRRLAIFKETSDYHEFLKCLAMTKETCVYMAFQKGTQTAPHGGIVPPQAGI